MGEHHPAASPEEAQALAQRQLRYRSVDKSADREPLGQSRQPLAECAVAGQLREALGRDGGEHRDGVARGGGVVEIRF